jgi:hypothetical protein
MIYGIIDRTLTTGRIQPKIKSQSDASNIDFAEVQKNIRENRRLESFEKIDIHGDGNLNTDEMKHTRTNITYRRIKHSDQTESEGLVQSE